LSLHVFAVFLPQLKVTIFLPAFLLLSHYMALAPAPQSRLMNLPQGGHLSAAAYFSSEKSNS
jgi:hypothetical protein